MVSFWIRRNEMGLRGRCENGLLECEHEMMKSKLVQWRVYVLRELDPDRSSKSGLALRTDPLIPYVRGEATEVCTSSHGYVSLRDLLEYSGCQSMSVWAHQESP